MTDSWSDPWGSSERAEEAPAEEAPAKEALEVYPTTPVAPPRRRRGKPIGIGAVVVVLVVGLAVGIVASQGGAKSADAVVIDSVNATLAHRTAHVSLTATETTSGTTISATGSGAIDFTQGSTQVLLNATVDGESVPIPVLYLAGTIYERIPGLSQLLPGKSWISLDVSSLTTSGGGAPSALGSGGNPVAMLRLYAQQGNTVVPLGRSTVDGVAVNGYSVTLNPAALKRQLSAPNVPSWIRQAVSNVDMQQMVSRLYIDHSGRLLRCVLHLDMSVSSTATTTVDETLDFSDYGVPVNIATPPSGQVASFQQFLQAARSAG